MQIDVIQNRSTLVGLLANIEARVVAQGQDKCLISEWVCYFKRPIDIFADRANFRL